MSRRAPQSRDSPRLIRPPATRHACGRLRCRAAAFDRQEGAIQLCMSGRITAGPRRARLGHRCGMLPDIRFAIGAVLAAALLIVTGFGLAATVRVAHHRTVSPFEASRVLAYADPVDWSAHPD